MSLPEVKLCGKCRSWKSLADFSRRSGECDGRQLWCKGCAADYYQANRAKIYPGIKERTKRVTQEIREHIWNYLITHPCVDCGESDPLVLDFDHVRGVKSHNVSEVARRGSLKKAIEEIAKCESRCANCHRRKTARDFGWWKDFLAS
jgi:hypothetical protein